MESPNEIYHSALAPAVASESMERYSFGDSVAFVHDLFSGPLPEEYDRCDLVYADLVWQPGFKKFERRAGKTPDPERTFKTYMQQVAAIIEARKWAAVLVTGKHAGKMLPMWDSLIPIILHGGNVNAYCYRHPRTNYLPEFLPDMDARDALETLATKKCNKVVGDFCCGYGRTGRIFQGLDKAWVMSDVNPRCIGMISMTAPTW